MLYLDALELKMEDKFVRLTEDMLDNKKKMDTAFTKTKDHFARKCE